MTATTAPRRWSTGHGLIRPMTTQDVPAVVALDHRIREGAWSPEVMHSELGGRGRTYVVATVPSGTGAPVRGFGGTMLVVDEVHVTTMGVDPGWRREGLATQLLRVLLEEAVAAGAVAATLEVAVGNEPAKALYRRFGFAPVGVRPGYYAATGEDALIMWAHDIDRPAYGELLSDLQGDWEVTG